MFKLSFSKFIGLAMVLAVLAYLCGRYALQGLAGNGTGSLVAFATATLALGALFGIPLGLYFGNARPQPVPESPAHSGTAEQQAKILTQIKAELAQNLALFDARKGNATVLARLNYLDSFWEAVKASGHLFVMQDPKLLTTIATAYYWIEQANRLEALAYEAKYTSAVVIDNQNAYTHLIAEARLLDGPLGIALQTAIDAINDQLGIGPAPTATPASTNTTAPTSAATAGPAPYQPTSR